MNFMFIPIFTSTLQSKKLDLVRPISEQEAHGVEKRIQKRLSVLVGRNLKINNVFLQNADKFATRTEVVHELYLVYVAAKPFFKLEPRTQYCDPKIIRLPLNTKNEALELIHWGFLPPTSNLLVGPKNYVSINQMGFVLGYYMSRMAQCTHLPEIKWSPKIENQQS